MLNQLNFSSIVSSGSATTQLGVELMERYLGALQRNGESHILVNSFVKEASRLQYDAGIRESLEKVAGFISEQPIKWTLATRCESILDGVTRDRHARPAATKASGLLELEEGELVSAIRAGALREVMHCEAFRSLANQVLGEIQTVVRTDEYTITHPLSYVEKVYDGIAVRVCGRNICQDDEYNLIPNYQGISASFLLLNEFIESGEAQIADHCITIRFNNNIFTICEAGKVRYNDEEMGVEQFRQQAQARLILSPANRKGALNRIFEAVALFAEHYDHVVYLDHVNIFTTPTGVSFAVIRYGEQLYAFGLRSFAFEIIGNALEVVEYIQQMTQVEVGTEYKDMLLAEPTTEPVKTTEDDLQARIQALTEKFKDHPKYLELLDELSKEIS